MGSQRQRRLVRSYPATDQRGKKYTVEHYEIILLNTALAGSANITKLLDELQLDTGEELDILGPGKYQIRETNVVLTSNDPNAL